MKFTEDATTCGFGDMPWDGQRHTDP